MGLPPPAVPERRRMEKKYVRTSIPGYRPSLIERETIITFNEAEEWANVYTFNPSLIRKIVAMEDREDVSFKTYEDINGVECCECTVPKKWVKINASRILSEEQKAALTERMKTINSRKSASETR